MIEFSPPIEPSFVLPVRYSQPSSRSTPIKPYGQSIPTQKRPQRIFPFGYKSMGRDAIDYILSFFHEIGSGDSAFLWRPPVEHFCPKHRGPDLDKTIVPGAVGERSYTVAYSWYSSELDNNGNPQESEISPTSSLVVPAGEVLTVTFPIRPNGVESQRIYAGEGGGPLTLQATDPDRVWQEPVSGLISGAMPPAASNLRPKIIASKLSELEPTKITGARWSLDLEFIEEWF